jgi:beta-lactamase regulating signal transducer with metallopeptidase domain
MLAVLLAAALGAALCLGVALALGRSRRLDAVDRHELLTVACALTLAMPLVVLAAPSWARFDLGPRLVPVVAVEDDVARGTVPLDPSPSQAAPAAPAAVERSARLAPSTWLGAAWAMGVLFCLARLVASARRTARARHGARPWKDGVLVSPEVRVPIVTGVFRPVIVLPADAPSWPDEELALALAHERAHIVRHDLAKQWLASLACALHWFNPLAWIAARRMATEREHAVDAVVVHGGGRGSSYAALLLRLATRSAQGGIFTPFHTPAVSGSELGRRVEAILAPPRARAPWLLRAAGAGAILGAALAVACGQASTADPSEPPFVEGAGNVEPQREAEALLAAWLDEDPDVVRAHVIAMAVPSGDVAVLAGHDRVRGAGSGLDHAYPPGSTIKPLLLAAALDAGVVAEDETLDGHGGSRVVVGDGRSRTMTDVWPRQRLSLTDLLMVSSNVGAIEIGERLGSARLVAALDAAGLFDPVDAEAAPGVRPSGGDALHFATVAMGHNVAVSPLRMVAAYRALAAGGELPPEGGTSRRFVGAESARVVVHMLESVVSDQGTGAAARVDGIRVAGKTGTADLDGGLFYLSFVGIFPADAPRWVVLVGAESRGGSGGSKAAPRFARFVERAFR